MKQYFSAPAEWKFAGDGSAMEFSGYGAVFGNVDAYGDVIAPGAFGETLRESKSSGLWPAMLLQHGGMSVTAEDMTPIGIWTAMEEDATGLKIEGKLADIPRARDLYTLMKMQPRSAINGLSVGYSVKSYTARTKPEEPRRTLTALKLWEVSPVTFPANDKARVLDVKSAAPSEIERIVRDALNLSNREAKAFLADGLSGLRRLRDVGDEAEDLADLLLRNINRLKGVAR
jgi:HK97 family phage prohead protease